MRDLIILVTEPERVADPNNEALEEEEVNLLLEENKVKVIETSCVEPKVRKAHGNSGSNLSPVVAQLEPEQWNVRTRKER